jgi:hypothetical protein
MAFGNGYPATYQPMYYQPQYTPQFQPPQQAQNNGMIWVSGEAGAKAYLVAPNTTVQLWDSEAQVIYLKSADASGMPSMKVLDYTIRDQAPANGPINAPSGGPINPPDYATHAEIEALTARVDALKAQIDSGAKKGASLNE